MTSRPKEGVLSEASLASAFSTRVFRGLAREWVAEVHRLRPFASLGLPPDSTVGEGFEQAHLRLRRTYRSEYIYKNEIVSKLVFGRHSPRTASAILEQPMGDSEADVFVLNGTSTVYEIKTDLDQLSRLDGQLRDYGTRADRVFVVTSEQRASLVEKQIPRRVGIVALTRRGTLSTIRDAESNLDRLDPDHLFNMLRTAEAVHVLRAEVGWTPDVPRGEVRTRARELFREFTVPSMHALVVDSLRRRGHSAAAITQHPGFPPSLRALAYGTELSRIGARRVLDRLNQPLSAALRS